MTSTVPGVAWLRIPSRQGTNATGADLLHSGRVSNSRFRSNGMPTGDDAAAVSDTEADEMEEHLRGLGYLE
jgi:hypothetical protein